MAGLSEAQEEHLGKVLEAQLYQRAQQRERVVVLASRVIDALTDKSAGVHSEPHDPGRDFASAPEAIPALGWRDVMTMGTEEKDMSLNIVGNVGEWFASTHSNERPSQVFNAAFYAGVLAAKEGLVDVSLFVHDDDLRIGRRAAEPSTE